MKAKKENQPSGEQVLSLEKAAINFNQVYLQNGDELLPLSSEYKISDSLAEKKFRSVKELEELMLGNSKMLFGQDTIMVPLTKESRALFGDFVPSGLLFDLSDLGRPRFFILDIMLSKQSFFSEVFPRITRFFSFFNSGENIDKICEVTAKNKQTNKELQRIMKAEDILIFLKGAFVQRPFILLIMDSEMKELPEVLQTYPETWQKVKQVSFYKFAGNGKTFCAMHPSFDQITHNERRIKVRSERRTATESPGESRDKVQCTEEDHLQKSSEEMRTVYNTVKTELLTTDSTLQFNAQRYYISLRNGGNLAFFKFSRKKIVLVVKYPEKETKKMLKHHEVRTLKESVQKFYNGPSCEVVIENDKHLNEVIALLLKMIVG